MSPLSDDAVDRLRDAVDFPDLSGTKYRLIREIARGGMGTVYLADDLDLDRKVALKVINIPDPTRGLASRMLREARVIARLEHPGIVPVHDVGTLPDDRVFYVMKYVQGSRLDQYAGDGALLSDLLRIFQKICDAAGFGHAHGVIHRDLKPENIMVGSFGEVLVMDWGVAKILELAETPPCSSSNTLETRQMEQSVTQPPAHRLGASTDTADGTIMGTPDYMAPEQAMGDIQRTDIRTDVYALGGILYFLLTRVAPHKGKSPRDINPAIARSLQAICLKAMATKPEDRYPGAQEIAADIARYIDGLPIQAYRENIFERAGRLLARNRFLVLLIAAYLLMRILVLLIFKR